MNGSTVSFPHRRDLRNMPDPEFRSFAQSLGYHVAMGAMRALATGVVWLLLLGVAIAVFVLGLGFSAPP